MKIAIHGLGRMGMQIARKLAESPEHTAIAHNRSTDKIDEAVGYGAVRAVSKQEVLAAFEGDRAVVWLMLPAEIVDQQIDEWLAVLPAG
ncbi:MAG TPA: NAD(P)-binding domain-containing protein, partial [Candidatus Saccharibacteria bacterium]|nr:NAD(P)-binding domain-containing protein [Candidatus Saccharibacteria bacterium]